MTEITRTRRQRRMAREENSGTTVAPETEVVLAVAAPTATGATTTKAARVLALLKRPEGVTLDQLVEATGWLPHSARAALTRLRKKGHVVTSAKAVHFDLEPDSLAFWDADTNWTVEPGTFTVSAGASSASLKNATLHVV